MDLAGTVDDFFSELVGIGGLILIAENIKDFGTMTGLNITISGICLEVQVDVVARLAVFDGKLPLHLPRSHPHKSNPPNG